MFLTDLAKALNIDYMENNLSLENLFKNAFYRTKERLLEYFLVSLITVGVFLGFALLVFLGIGLTAGIFTISKIFLSGAFFAFIYFFSLCLVLLWAASWTQLALIKIVISKEKISVSQSFQSTKPLILSFLKLQLFQGIFFLGLLLPSLFTLFVPYLVWIIWSSFTALVFLEKQEKGLQNLWVSKSLFNKNFWNTAGKLLLAVLLIWLLQIIVSSLGGNFFGSLLSIFLSLIGGLFLLSYNYEIYHNLPKPDNSPQPKIWLTVSLFGWIFTAVLVILALFLLPQLFVNNIKNLKLPVDLPSLKPFLMTPTPQPNFFQEVPKAI